MNRKIAVFFFSLIFVEFLSAEPLRSFDEIFPNLTQSQKRIAMSGEGLKRSHDKSSFSLLTPAPGLGIEISGVIMEKQPSHIIEALVVVPYTNRILNRLDAYNAIGRIKNIKEHAYFSRPQNKYVVIFKDTTRLESDIKRNPIPDPLPSKLLPLSETVYLRFEDASFGSLYIRGDISANPYGITYKMTNFAPVRFLIFTILKAEKFSAIVYVEPVKEGILVYGMSGIEIPDFIADRLDVSSDIEKRLSVLIYWLTDGLGRQL